jgi:hypothetical protein
MDEVAIAIAGIISVFGIAPAIIFSFIYKVS